MIDVDRADGVVLVTDDPRMWRGGRVVRPHYLAAAAGVPVFCPITEADRAQVMAAQADAVDLAAEDLAAEDLAAAELATAVRTLADARRTVATIDAIAEAIADAIAALADAQAVAAAAADDAVVDAGVVAAAVAALDTLGAP